MTSCRAGKTAALPGRATPAAHELGASTGTNESMAHARSNGLGHVTTTRTLHIHTNSKSPTLRNDTPGFQHRNQPCRNGRVAKSARKPAAHQYGSNATRRPITMPPPARGAKAAMHKHRKRPTKPLTGPGSRTTDTHPHETMLAGLNGRFAHRQDEQLPKKSHQNGALRPTENLAITSCDLCPRNAIADPQEYV